MMTARQMVMMLSASGHETPSPRNLGNWGKIVLAAPAGIWMTIGMPACQMKMLTQASEAPPTAINHEKRNSGRTTRRIVNAKTVVNRIPIVISMSMQM